MSFEFIIYDEYMTAIGSSSTNVGRQMALNTLLHDKCSNISAFEGVDLYAFPAECVDEPEIPTLF